MVRLVVVGSSGWIGRALTAMADQFPFCLDTVTVGIPRATGPVQELRAQLMPAPDLAVVLVAGLKSGNRSELFRANQELPRLLVTALAGSGAHLVHLGSAAEYGDPKSPLPIRENFAALPTSDYGVSKLAGTTEVLRYPHSCVLRAFNVADRFIPEEHVLTELRKKVEMACRTGTTVDLLSANTVRDFVSRRFVVTSLLHAAHQRTIGLFNVCSGVGSAYGEIVTEMGKVLECKPSLNDLGIPGIASVVGNPSAWSNESGLSECMSTAELARLILGRMTSDDRA